MDTTGFNRRYHLEHSENSPEISEGDSPRFAMIASTSSSKRSSRRGIQKRVVSVAMKDVEGLRVKADQISAPPSDSWAWRKYGQKPIKGSPYPRGYYRCSSSKGCPARKQVERSRADPKMLLVTYYCEHNHSWPLSKTKTAARSSFKTPPSEDEAEEEDEEEVEEEDQEEEEEKKPLNNILSDDELVNKFSANLGEGLPIHNAHEFGWFADLDCTSCSMFESPMLTQDRITTTDTEMPMIFTMRDEDDSLFADLGELPECSAVLRRGMADQRRPTLATTS